MGPDISFERVAAGESNEVFIVRRGGSTRALRRPSAVPLSVRVARNPQTPATKGFSRQLR